MDELQLVRELTKDTPLPEPTEIAPARERLLAAASAEARDELAPRRRFTRLGLVGAGVAAAAVAAVAIISPFGGSAPSAHAEAVRVLHQAADAARTLPAVDPRPDQFLFIKERYPTTVSEEWLSVDGTRDGLIRRDGEEIRWPGCRDGRREMVKGDEVLGTEECEPQPAVRTDLPTDADAMYRYLTEGRDDVNAIAKEANVVLQEAATSPEARAAVFEALAKVDGVELVDGVRDAAGRTGVGVAWAHAGEPAAVKLIFDPETHAYLGSPETSLVELALVDEVGQRP
ncbi:hypothetical protein SAMN05421810_102669 [Amycolatopsis arida]|uniref:CU044_5270 family protein n=1 Tax=Amycolatopsis arida TaxID=587909 RepID=A0A1I5QKI7_9PSEU|nr:CU044_5270 family protein [Amycolatopsis arida]TDX98873.1 hypothetical protein CLV69_101670 [Amycolatopsis arida]SFP46607.1 hypothetical protein SAMN05421810_102669 [Amycolatopsis arida]